MACMKLYLFLCTAYKYSVCVYGSLLKGEAPKMRLHHFVRVCIQCSVYKMYVYANVYVYSLQI